MKLKARQALENGLSALKQGDLKKSELLLKSVLAVFPDDWVTNFYLALAYQRSHDDDLALKYFIKTVSLKPDQTSVWRYFLQFILESPKGNLPTDVIDTIPTNVRQAKEISSLIRDVLEKHSQSRAKHVLEQASLAFERNDHTGVLETLSELSISEILKIPDLANIYSIGLIRTKDFQKAQVILEALSADFPHRIGLKTNLAICYKEQGQLYKARRTLETAVDIDPKNAELFCNLGNLLIELNELNQAEIILNHAYSLRPKMSEVLFNLGVLYRKIGKPLDSLRFFETLLSEEPRHIAALKNCAAVLHEVSEFERAEELLCRLKELAPFDAGIASNFGNLLVSKGEIAEARKYFQEALKLEPSFFHALWNMQATTSDLKEAFQFVTKALTCAPSNVRADIYAAQMGLKSFLQQLKGQEKAFIDSSPHPIIRSVRWVNGLPQRPPLFFNRWELFDFCVNLAPENTAFYEFGVWKGHSFRYLSKNFDESIGFDTFTGLPEDWHSEKKGNYTAHGNLPKIPNARFIVGEFQDSCPKFFQQERPTAGLINFDADLYSSTLVALTSASKVITSDTILVFDEFLVNEHWEQDEYRALVEFCSAKACNFEVIAFSLFTKQVAVKLGSWRKPAIN